MLAWEPSSDPLWNAQHPALLAWPSVISAHQISHCPLPLHSHKAESNYEKQSSFDGRTCLENDERIRNVLRLRVTFFIGTSLQILASFWECFGWRLKPFFNKLCECFDYMRTEVCSWILTVKENSLQENRIPLANMRYLCIFQWWQMCFYLLI